VIREILLILSDKLIYMKKLLLLFTVFSSLFTQAQVQKTYEINTFNFVNSIVNGVNEVVMVLNVMPVSNSDIVLITTDLSLGTNTQRMYAGTGTDESYSVIKTFDNGNLITGATKSWGAGNYDAFAIRTDNIGNIVWSKCYGSTSDDYFYSATELSDSTIVFTGTSNKIPSMNCLVLTKTDDNGDTLFTKIYETSAGNAEGMHIMEAANGDLLIAGFLDTTTTNLRGSLLMRTDVSGNIIWTRVFNNIGPEIFYKLTEDSQGNIYATGYWYENNIIKSTLAKCDANGNLIWMKKYTGFQSSEGLTKINDNLFVMAGYGKNILTTNAHSFVVAVDSTGDVLWAKRYGGLRQSMFNAVTYFQNSLYFGGYLASSPGDNAYAVKADSSGNSFICYEENVSINDSIMNVPEIYTDPFAQISSGLDVENANPVVSNPSVTENTLQNMSLSFTIQNVFADGNCNGSATVNPVNGTAPYNYEWSNFQNSQGINSLCAGSYIVDVQDDLGCIVSDTAWINIISPENPICLVTVDSTSTKNYIVWDKPAYGFLDSFRVYRDIAGVYTLVGATDYDSLSRFTDNSPGVDPNVTSYWYKITTVDTLGNESILSEYHKTLHLTTNVGGSGERNLIWDGYQGFSWGYYYRILRDTLNNGTFAVLDSVTNLNFTYTDWTAPAGVTVNYLIEIVYPGGCTATRAVNHNSTRSNRSQSGVTGTGQVEFPFLDFSILPNPASGTVQFFSAAFDRSETEIIIYSGDGKQVFRKQFNDRSRNKTADISNLSPGLYIVKAITNDSSRINKLVVTE